ncbi:integrin alpha-IIb-like, partial [Numida meleagris]|uniref:integrin alpha-IIb-like n=1 Tax=Numida meleagris TaxID=8996 RepID=UPI000B3D8696
MGNPMKAGTQITVAMELSVPALEDAGDAITFHLQLRSKNSPGASAAVTIPVEAHAEMELRGASLPATTVLPAEWQRDGEEHEVRVEHVYQLHNKGPAAVTGVTLLLRVPVTAGGRELLRLREPETEGEVTCEQLEAPGPAGAEQRNGTGPRERGDAGDAEENVTVDCASARCSEVRCRAARLAQGQRVLVSVRAL